MDAILIQIWKKKFVFLGAFFLVFTVSYIVLLAVDFLPEPPTTEEIEVTDPAQGVDVVDMETSENVSQEEVVVEEGSDINLSNSGVDSITVIETSGQPIRISIEKLGKDITVLNPTSRTIADLDNALLGGVVRHPDSATLAQEGNVFILGHSSYLPKVFNENFQAFNGIQNLEWGDTIEVFTESSVFEYRVEKVYRAKAQDVTVPIAGTGNMLTLATCNSFGSTDDRYIVEAKQISAKNL